MRTALALLSARAADDGHRHAAAVDAAYALCGRPVAAEVDQGFDVTHPQACEVCALAVVLEAPPKERL